MPEMLSVMEAEKGTIKVVNFWATWCKPCIKELPYFTKAAEEFPAVEFIFISLDFSDQLKKVEAFSKKKGLTAGKRYLIDDVDYNAWIDKVSTSWSGAIPATVIVTTKEKKFYEKEFHQGELEALIKSTLKNN